MKVKSPPKVKVFKKEISLVARSPHRVQARLCGTLLVFLSPLIFAGYALAASSISGWVQTRDGKRLPNIEIRLTNLGGIATSQSGEFSIPLPSDIAPGDPIMFHVRGWVITDPYVGQPGRTFVPKILHQTELIRVVVARKGDSALLGDREYLRRLLEEATNQLKPPATPAPSQDDDFLVQKAKELGFTVTQLKTAIGDWSTKVHEPYQKGLAALYAQRYREASQYIQDSVAASESQLLEKYISLASAEYYQGKYLSAEAALAKARTMFPKDPVILNNLGLVLTAQAKYSEAEPLHRQALDIDEKALGPDHPAVATSLNNLAAVYDDQGKYAEGEPLYQRALTIREKTLGPDHPNVATSLNNLAELYREQGKYAEAERLYQRALTIDEKALGPDHPAVATIAENFARTLYQLGRDSEAKALEAKAAAIRKNNH